MRLGSHRSSPVHSSDVRLRRAQALALQNGTALTISRELRDRKLAAQERAVKNGFCSESAALAIRKWLSELAEASSIEAVRSVEAKGPKVYWATWRGLGVMFPRQDLQRVPEHWRTFGSRISSLTASPRRATNPVNAILNYLYALLEVQARLAAAKLGLDPGLGVLHADTQYRESLACDLMEPIRPEVDAFVLDWLQREPLLRSYFFEERDGNCRLTSSFALKLSETAPIWARLVAPVAEWFAQQIHKSRASQSRVRLLARPTSAARREKKITSHVERKLSFRRAKVCVTCGKKIHSPSTTCDECAKQKSPERIIEVARLGRIVTLVPEAQAKRSATQKVNTQAVWDWNPSDHPKLVTSDVYSAQIKPRLISLSCSLVGKRLGVSVGYADQIRKGRVLHPRLWQALAKIAGVSE
ncbi:CRISPR-associated endonuclease Cas1 [Tunturiibacter gelidoferens]|uniref:CRISPR-associated endonuclease Cas1 n=1 Tax=Tunturiibacter gelidiferens TaxID=3069689 RepID=UPI0016141226|nr:CRISPR-associated endonuclease Cas1 [Edaphobacter lichenicola]